MQFTNSLVKGTTSVCTATAVPGHSHIKVIDYWRFMLLDIENTCNAVMWIDDK